MLVRQLRMTQRSDSNLFARSSVGRPQIAGKRSLVGASRDVLSSSRRKSFFRPVVLKANKARVNALLLGARALNSTQQALVGGGASRRRRRPATRTDPSDHRR